jgi:hypothetical protein
MSLFSKSKKSKNVIICISENGVQGAIIDLNKPNNRDVFIYKTIKKTVTKINLNSFSELKKATGSVISELLNEEKRKETKRVFFENNEINKFIFVVDSPFQHSYVEKYSLENTAPIKVTDEFIKKFLEQQSPEIKDFSVLNKEEPLVFIKKDITSVNLNGYPTGQLDEIEARNVDLSIFNSVIPKRIAEKLYYQVKKNSPSASVEFFSQDDVDLAFINQFQKKDLYRYVKINMSESLIAIVNKNVPIKINHMEYGYFDLIKKIAKKIKVPEFVAYSYLSMYFSNQCEKKFSTKIKKIIAPVLNTWEIEYEKEMKEIPHNVYLKSNKLTEQYFKEILIKKYPETKVSTLRELYSENISATGDDSEHVLAINTNFINRLVP